MSLRRPCDCALASEELVDAAQSRTQLRLGGPAVEADVECTGMRGAGAEARRQSGSIKPVPLSDQHTQAVTTHGVGTRKVMYAARVDEGQLQQGGG